jgi:cardiolipin synthase A/B
MLLADGQLAFVGSENFSATSLDDNRELGIMIADPTALATLNQTFQQDWSSAQAA